MVKPLIRGALIVFGWLNVALGFVGVVLPGLPTTPFLLVALWAFAQGSERFHDWLYGHPRFGPTLRAWREHRVVPTKAKVLALVTMAGSLVYVSVFVAEGWIPATVMACVMLPTAIWLLTRSATVNPAGYPARGELES